MKISIELREANKDDIEQIVILVNSAYSKWIPVVHRKPTPMTTNYNVAICEHDVKLAMVDQLIVGLIETQPRENYLWIENLAVAPEWQGHGIGKKLLQAIEHEATTINLHEIQLQTNAAFISNIAIYKHVGYHIVRFETIQDGKTVFMKKSLG